MTIVAMRAVVLAGLFSILALAACGSDDSPAPGSCAALGGTCEHGALTAKPLTCDNGYTEVSANDCPAPGDPAGESGICCAPSRDR